MRSWACAEGEQARDLMARARELREAAASAKHHARWREPTADERAAAVAELRELAGGPRRLARPGRRDPRGRVPGAAR
jgi:hypothetical protein